MSKKLDIHYNGRTAVGIGAALTTHRALPAPPAVGNLAPNAGPWEVDTVPVSRLWWSALTSGYGLPSQYAIEWKLGAMAGMAAPQILSELRAVAAVRLRLLKSAYRVHPVANALVRRGVYQFIEDSEKRLSSYVLGSTLAQYCRPRCMHKLGLGTPGRLFHVMLLKSAALCHVPIIMLPDRRPDYIAFDEFGRSHLFEAKSRGDYKFRPFIEGFEQVDPVLTIDGCPVFTKTVVGSFPVRLPPGGAYAGEIIASSVVTRVADPAQREQPVAIGNPVPALLGALYITGMAWLVEALAGDAVAGADVVGDPNFVSFGIANGADAEGRLRVWLHAGAAGLLHEVFESWADPQRTLEESLLAAAACLAECDLVEAGAVDPAPGIAWIEGHWLGVSVDNAAPA